MSSSVCHRIGVRIGLRVGKPADEVIKHFTGNGGRDLARARVGKRIQERTWNRVMDSVPDDNWIHALQSVRTPIWTRAWNRIENRVRERVENHETR